MKTFFKKLALELAVTFKVVSMVSAILLLAEFVYEMYWRPESMIGLLLVPVPFLVALSVFAYFCQKKLQKEVG